MKKAGQAFTPIILQYLHVLECIGAEGTVEPVFKDHSIHHQNKVSQDMQTVLYNEIDQ